RATAAVPPAAGGVKAGRPASGYPAAPSKAALSGNGPAAARIVTAPSAASSAPFVGAGDSVSVLKVLSATAVAVTPSVASRFNTDRPGRAAPDTVNVSSATEPSAPGASGPVPRAD